MKKDGSGGERPPVEFSTSNPPNVFGTLIALQDAMRRRRKSDEFFETVIVETDDGKTFRCSLAATGHEVEPRWNLMDEHATQYVGPLVEPDHTPEAVQRQISAWWAERTGQSQPKAAPDE